MRMFNADGSESEMCGNGVRCVAKYVYDHGIAKKSPLKIETGDGVLGRSTLEVDERQSPPRDGRHGPADSRSREDSGRAATASTPTAASSMCRSSITFRREPFAAGATQSASIRG